MPKYRSNKIKHEHTIIPGLRPVLEEMAACPAVHAIIPGPIRPHHMPHGLRVTIQYETNTGLKLLGRNGSAVQEVFLVTPDPGAVRDFLIRTGLAEGRHGDGDAPPAWPQANARPGKPVTVMFEHTCTACGRRIAPGSRAIRIGKGGSDTYMHVRCARSAGTH